MSDCERFESTIEAYVSGELGAAAIGPLLAHCRTCEGCRRLLELHRDLSGVAGRAPEPNDAELERLDRALRAAFARGGAPHPAQPARRPGPSIGIFAAGAFLRRASALAAGILLFAAGLFAGLAVKGRPGRIEGENAAARLVHALSADAASNRDLQDVENSRFTYSNVSPRRVDGDRVELEFDVTTHVRLEEPVRSELVRDVLVQTLLNPSSTGARLKAMSLASGPLGPKVKEALVFAMGHDESLAVRLEALTVLASDLRDRDVEAAVLAALRDDESVPMRLLALEALTAHRVDRERLRGAIREDERPGKEALMVRLAEYEKRL